MIRLSSRNSPPNRIRLVGSAPGIRLSRRVLLRTDKKKRSGWVKRPQTPHLTMVIPKDFWPTSAEQRLKDLGIQLPSAPAPFGTYVETVQLGNLLFLSGMLPVV